MGYFTKISGIWLLLAIQVQAETSGSLEITGSFFPKSLDASFDTNITAEAKVIAVCVNSTPEIPFMNMRGTKTAISTTVVAIIAKATCFAPL